MPQRCGFKLVFVGRRGWMVDDVLELLDRPHAFADTVVHFTGMPDEELWRLYEGAAFCLYASRYEGFGLPLVEAFARGKAVIASRGGSLAEVAGDLAPCLDPDDEDAWTATLQTWIEKPEIAAAHAARVKQCFVPRAWNEVGSEMFRAVSQASAFENFSR